MIERIKTVEDVQAFAEHLFNTERLNFHPDCDFREYVNMGSSERTYSEQDAEKRNRMMAECFRVCKKNKTDIYEVMGEPLFRAILQKPL